MDNQMEMRMLDVGCGTGEWAVRAAQEYPEAAVVGIDLITMDVLRKPCDLAAAAPNAHFFNYSIDYNQDWPRALGDFDFVHLSLLAGKIDDWPTTYKRASRCMRPNGIVEHVEISWEPHSTDSAGLQADELPLMQWYRDMESATANIGKPFALRRDTCQQLQAAGFEDVDEATFQIPFWEYRPRDPHRHKLSNWIHTILSENSGAWERSFFARCVLLFTHVLGYDEQQVRQMCQDAARIVCREDSPLYYNLHVWRGRKPQR
ncbi:hypothetical protein LTR78_009992 [Recurvomyces mirabilis]|uniref:Methyltransferase n=1 Tax=Recurvomyces mirabilis TaxID=574656 RepID=A0AAE0TNM5_9PEZI|nr:hypothetical protein LTR78_009992 [Recurvomyces mirabilis]KAK5160333.1 hypothetical protein LTS14_001345 [Recurvomyces mirabilis]